MRHSTAIERALNYLQTGIKSGLWPAGARLPTMRILAHDARVAYASMQTAARMLAQKDLLTIEGKNGIYIGKRLAATPSAAPRPLMRWEQLKQSLKKDMVCGAFDDQNLLPNIHQLQKQYSVSAETLRKAIKTLMAEGALVNDKRRYRIVRIKRPLRFTSILLISLGISIAKVKIYSYKFREFYQALEGRCIRSNIRLDWCGVTAENQNDVYAYLKKQKESFGYCLYADGIAAPLTNKILHMLEGRGRPIAVVSESSDFKLPAIQCPCTAFFGAAFLAGRQVGQFLRELGHKRIAFVSLYPEQPWSQKRYEGLAQAFLETGARDCVKLAAINNSDTALAKNTPSIIRQIERMTGINKEFPWRKSVPSIEEYEQINTRLRNLSILRGLYDILPEYFSNLLKDSSITAIVGAQDYITILAHEFLKQQDVSVPGNISLCGFDNAEMAIEDDLTSYNFLFSNIAADVLAYIINPSAPAFTGKREIECSGAIIQRSTTGPARRK